MNSTGGLSRRTTKNDSSAISSLVFGGADPTADTPPTQGKIEAVQREDPKVAVVSDEMFAKMQNIENRIEAKLQEIDKMFVGQNPDKVERKVESKVESNPNANQNMQGGMDEAQ